MNWAGTVAHHVVHLPAGHRDVCGAARKAQRAADLHVREHDEHAVVRLVAHEECALGILEPLSELAKAGRVAWVVPTHDGIVTRSLVQDG